MDVPVSIREVAAHALTRSRVALATISGRLRTLDTVPTDTPELEVRRSSRMSVAQPLRQSAVGI